MRLFLMEDRECSSRPTFLGAEGICYKRYLESQVAQNNRLRVAENSFKVAHDYGPLGFKMRVTERRPMWAALKSPIGIM